MKKLVALLILAALCITFVLPVAAEEFVPSISYKDSPDIVGTPEITDKEDKEVVGAQVVITPVSDALNTKEEDRTEGEAQLVEVFEQLTTGDMKMPVPGADGTEKVFVVRDLFDVSIDFGTEEPVEEVNIAITFDLGIAADAEVAVMFFDGTWISVENIKNNGDGTVTVIFDKVGPVAFCVEDAEKSPTPPTSDSLGQKLIPWAVLLVLASGAAISMLVSRRKVTG